ncbi:MAG: CoA pyrophosphatase [Planctomycetes bacterium]|nr:CoA pyrophosphatase [Planctomycetota bacterium]
MNALVDILDRRLNAVGPVGSRTRGYALGAVALLLHARPHDIGFLAIQRPAHMPQHGGQISLPGGGVHEVDESPSAAALRETEEELGIPRPRIRLVGALGHFPIAVSRWDVLAYLGWWEGGHPLRPQKAEVEAVLDVALDDVAHQHRERFRGRTYTPLDYPEYFHRQEGRSYRIWGCTGRILHHFLERIYLPRDAVS